MILNYYVFRFQQLQRELQLLVNQPSYPKITDIIINSCYLAQDPEGDEYARVIVRNIEEDMVDCFFVDFGDYTKVQKNELKFLPDNFITRLPFQVRNSFMSVLHINKN